MLACFVVFFPILTVSGEVQDELIIPELKFSESTIFTVLGLSGENYLAISDNALIRGESKFLILGLKTGSGNVTFQIEVFLIYEEFYDENNTFRVNSTLAEPRRFLTVDSTNFQEFVNIQDYSEKVWVKISLGYVYFLFEFETVWDYQMVTKTNVEWLSEKLVDNWVLIFIGSVFCIILSVAIVDKAGPFPGVSEKEVLPALWFLIGFFSAFIGIAARPPNMFMFAGGFFFLLMEFTIYPLSTIKRKNLKFLLFDDLVSETNILVHVLEKGRDMVYINYLSYTDLFLRPFLKPRLLPVGDFLRRQKGKIHFKVYASEVDLPDYSFKMEDSPQYRLVLLIMCAIVFAISVVFDFPVLMVLIFILIGLYVTGWGKIGTKEFKAKFYTKTAAKLFADSLAEKMKEQEARISVLIKRIELDIDKTEQIKYKHLKTEDKIALRHLRSGIIQDLKKASEEIKVSIEVLKEIKENPDNMIEELKTLNKAAERVEDLMRSNSELRRRVLVGEGLKEVNDILELEKKLYPKNFKEKFETEQKKLEKKIQENKFKSRPEVEEGDSKKEEGSKAKEGGKVV